MPSMRNVARFNRAFANKIAGPIFTRLSGFGEVLHVGRKSGRAYRTPVKVFRSGTDYVITLPYGPEADWVRNVLAAGRCELSIRGRQVPVVPRLFADDGSVAIPWLPRVILRRMGVTVFLALTPVRAAAGDPLRGVAR